MAIYRCSNCGHEPLAAALIVDSTHDRRPIGETINATAAVAAESLWPSRLVDEQELTIAWAGSDAVDDAEAQWPRRDHFAPISR